MSNETQKLSKVEIRIFSSHPYTGGKFTARIETAWKNIQIPKEAFLALLNTKIIGNPIARTNRENEYFLTSESELSRLKEEGASLSNHIEILIDEKNQKSAQIMELKSRIRELEQQLKGEREIREAGFCPRCKVELIPSTTSDGWLACPICHISIREQNTVSFTEWVSIEGWVFIWEKQIWINMLEILSLLRANYRSSKTKSTRELLDYFTKNVKLL
jgi:predicted CopG family antitoxin